ncbi:acyltransferase [Romboutsia sedimentorum]|uniref:acyltransferase n=1 Tax=Romboutsia sedimentorum TaxID=1368474 RepID=UPI0024DE32CC|nr:acyltransferase [Romboutsia sedimentorum]MDK2586342.1 acyltransferase [Romboutsia sedimentorum]
MIKKLLNKLLFPNTCSSEAYVKFLRRRGCKIGKNTRFISPKSTSVDLGRLEYISIGENCCLSVVSIIAHDYSWYILARSHNDILPDRGGKVEIGNNVFVGYKSIILKNTSIGDDVIIGANSLVNRDIPTGTVWAGNPIRQICTLDEFYEKRRKNNIESAKYRANIVYNEKNRIPSIEEMGFFSYLFLPRTIENFDKYLKNLEFNGIVNDSLIKNLFFNSKPKYNSYEEFLKDTFI